LEAFAPNSASAHHDNPKLVHPSTALFVFRPTALYQLHKRDSLHPSFERLNLRLTLLRTALVLAIAGLIISHDVVSDYKIKKFPATSNMQVT